MPSPRMVGTESTRFRPKKIWKAAVRNEAASSNHIIRNEAHTIIIYYRFMIMITSTCKIG